MTTTTAQYTLVSYRDRVHRSTCKRVTLALCTAPQPTDGLAQCCRPKVPADLFQVDPMAEDVIAEACLDAAHVQDPEDQEPTDAVHPMVPGYGDQEPQEAAVRKAVANATAATALAILDSGPYDPDTARAEQEALRQAKANGQPLPPTPHLERMLAAHQPGGPKRQQPATEPRERQVDLPASVLQERVGQVLAAFPDASQAAIVKAIRASGLSVSGGRVRVAYYTLRPKADG